jgi:hypothetical protein
MNAELVHHFLKNSRFAQTVVGANQTLASGIAYNQKTTAALVNRKSPFLVSSIIDADQFPP